MNLRLSDTARLAVVLIASAAPGHAQDLANSVQLRDVPFQAIQVVTRQTPTGATTTRGRIARDHTGSTYVELVDSSTGVATTGFLLDVPGRRGVVLDLVHKRYSVRAAPELSTRSLQPASVLSTLEAAARDKGQSDAGRYQGLPSTVTQLGTKYISGLISIGSEETWPTPAGHTVATHELERWLSVELGIYVRMTELDRAQQQRTEVTLTEVSRVEPSPSLFQIPSDFRPEGKPRRTPGPAADGD